MIRDLSPNALGAIYMTLGSLAYVLNDGLIRMAAEEGLDVYQALFLRGLAMILIFAAACRARNERLNRASLSPPLILRVVAEIVGTAAFFAAIIHLEFANAQTILMLVPFAVTVVAAKRGEVVSLSRYLLVAVGFIGVIIVIRPTPAAFSPWALLVVAAAVAIVVREFATRQISSAIRPLPIALFTSVSITSMMGAISLLRGWGDITAKAVGLLTLACFCLIAGYLFVIETVRVGDLSVSSPFRYTSVVGAVVVGVAFFDEVPDALTLVGCVLIIAAGIVSARYDSTPTSARPQAPATPPG